MVMHCSRCDELVENYHLFCFNCGHELLSDLNDVDKILKSYFMSGYKYTDILQLLDHEHQIQMSYNTLLRRFNKLGLWRRCGYKKQLNSDLHAVAAQRVRELLNGPSSCGGYRSIWHTLMMEGIRVPRLHIQKMLKEMDPEGCLLRSQHCLRRRQYHNPGPNYAWHIDGYDKLKPYGFPIHGAIDGFSRKVLWLNICRSNNSPDNVARFYLQCVRDVGGCPKKVVTDLGTENSLVASLQAWFRSDVDGHQYVSSPRNQRIEGWWSSFNKSHAIWWRNYFADMSFKNTLDMSSPLSRECLWYCFSTVLQKKLDYCRNHWNTHLIRKSRHNTVSGRPNIIFQLPEQFGGLNDLKTEIDAENLSFASDQVKREEVVEERKLYHDYCEQTRNTFGVEKPSTVKEAEELYGRIMSVAGENP